MVTALLAGIRSVRSAFLTGALLLGSAYIVVGGDSPSDLQFRRSASTILDIHPNTPLFLLLGACFLLGSLYITGLEGVVDWLHRRYVGRHHQRSRGRIGNAVVGWFLPLSESSKRRLVIEAERFYNEFGHDISTLDQYIPRTQAEFADQVLADVLWMEGKLTGSPLRETYDEYRAEGEFRLGLGLLLPFAAFAGSYAMRLDRLWGLVVVVASMVVSIQLSNYGLYYHRRAHSFLGHHIADGTLLTPSMETLKRNVQKPASAENDSVV